MILFHCGKDLLAKTEFIVSRIWLLNSRCYLLLVNHGCSAACRFMGWKQQVSGDGPSWAGVGGKVILRIGLKLFDRDQPRTQNPEKPLQTGTKTILESSS